MADTSSTLSMKAHRALAALLTASSVEDAAQTAGVGARTLYRWLRSDAAFQEAYRRARRQVMEQAAARLQQASGKAVEALLEILEDREVYAAVRVTAAKAILDMAMRAWETDDLERRIQALEHPPQGDQSNGMVTVGYTS